ncbi:unnamed protein product [Didymodactylos carnosus]|uniref:Uncharacterized protein n=1 Tax=Didymodactylos carnosus TaxID=1234261 RepID=A0A814VHK9_9BILA|nr:unnamed protein product [Didymodactylos carnosus]CAF3951857.1 unnamed protein product [Didymodactylos carnosus]
MSFSIQNQIRNELNSLINNETRYISVDNQISTIAYNIYLEKEKRQLQNLKRNTIVIEQKEQDEWISQMKNVHSDWVPKAFYVGKLHSQLPSASTIIVYGGICLNIDHIKFTENYANAHSNETPQARIHAYSPPEKTHGRQYRQMKYSYNLFNLYCSHAPFHQEMKERVKKWGRKELKKNPGRHLDFDHTRDMLCYGRYVPRSENRSMGARLGKEGERQRTLTELPDANFCVWLYDTCHNAYVMNLTSATLVY